MHECVAKLALGGDIRQVVVYDKFNPVTWPEVLVLGHLHGGDAIFDVQAFRDVPMEPRTERERLAAKYGNQVYTIFPGHTPLMEMHQPGVKLAEPVERSLADLMPEREDEDEQDDIETMLDLAPDVPVKRKRR